MSDYRNVGFRLACLLLGAVVVVSLLGCPPPQSATAPPEEPEITPHVLDSLRADSLRKCRFHRSFAFQYARSGLQTDAITQFEKALIYCKGDAEVERFYAQYLNQWGMKDSAYVHYRRAGELDTTQVSTHFWLYSYYHDMGDYPRAIEELLMSARHQEDQATKVRWLKTAADMMVAENMQERACDLYAYLQSLKLEDSEIIREVAQQMLNCVGDDPVKRLSTLRAACLADTLNRKLCRDLYAREEENAGNDGAALAVYLRFARLDSSDVTSWEAVLRTARRLNSTAIVLSTLRQLARLEPSNPTRVGVLVEELFAQGRTAEGVAVLLPKLREFPESAHLLYLAGQYYSRQPSPSDKRTALEYLDRAVLTNDPAWKAQALSLHDSIEPPLTEDEINQAKFFGRKVERLHRCRIPGREKQNEVIEVIE